MMNMKAGFFILLKPVLSVCTSTVAEQMLVCFPFVCLLESETSGYFNFKYRTIT